MRCSNLLGERVTARDFDRQVAELQIRAPILNRFTACGTTRTRRSRQVRPPQGETRPQADLLKITGQSDRFMADFDCPITDTVTCCKEGFATLFGAELHAPAPANGEIRYVLAVGVPADFAPANPGETGPELVRRARDDDAFVAIAHPQRYGLMIEDARELAFADAIKACNHICQIRADRPDGSAVLDRMLSEGQNPFATATAIDAAHFRDMTRRRGRCLPM